MDGNPTVTLKLNRPLDFAAVKDPSSAVYNETACW